jgi:hypothetical protein
MISRPESVGSSRVAWKFAGRELKAHIRIFSLIIIIMAIVTTPFSLSLNFNHYLNTVVKSSIQDSVSSQVVMVKPKNVSVDEAATGSTAIIQNAKERVETLRAKGLNASLRHVCLEDVALPGGITHQAQIWGIDVVNDSAVCSLRDFLVEGEWFDPEENYLLPGESESFASSLVQDMIPESQWIQLMVILWASFPVLNQTWYRFMLPPLEWVTNLAESILYLAPYPFSLYAELPDFMFTSILPERVTNPENFLASVLETVSPHLANILPMLAMLKNVEEDIERLNLPTSVVFWVQLEDYAKEISKFSPLLGRIITNVVVPLMDNLISAYHVETIYPVVIGKSFAEDWGLEVGNAIMIMPEYTGRRGGISGYVPARITGIIDTGLAELERWRFYMPLESVGQMKGYQPKEGVQILVKGEETEEGEQETLAMVRETFDDLEIFTWNDYVKVIYGNFVNLVLPLTLGIMVIALISAVAAIVSTMDSVARRRMREIGYLKAYGLRNSGAINMVLFQALTMGIIAGLIGIGLFLAGVRIMNIRMGVMMSINLPYMVIVGIIPVVTAVLGALPAGIRIARLQPVVALRQGEMEV